MGLLSSPFARKLIGALLGTVLLIAAGVGWAVRSATQDQIVTVSERTFRQAEESLRTLEQVRLDILVDRMGPFLRTARVLAAVEEVERSDSVSLIGELDYYRESSVIDELLLVFHGPEGGTRYAVVLRDDDAGGSVEMEGVDPLGLVGQTDAAFEVESGRASGYRRIGERVFRTESVVLVDEEQYVEGFFTVGSPISDADLAEVGRLAGVEICFLHGERCLVGTERARSVLGSVFAEAGASAGVGMLGMFEDPQGARWELLGSESGPTDDVRRAYAVPLDPVLTPFEGITRGLLAGVVGSLLLATLVAAVIARSMTAPVLRLTEATRRIGAGDFETRVEVGSRDEIGDLGHAFNGMAEGLALKERYRGVLDKVVAPEVARELMAGEVVLGGETRAATVLFGDLRGFTEHTGEMEPEAVIEMLNAYMERLAAEVDRAGGVVDKFVGDEIMALFGAPVSHPDDPERAVRAAIAMQEAIAALNDQRTARGEPALGLGIGINSGRVVAGNMGSPERLNYTVLGSTVNLAARLCSVAEAGETLVGPGTVEALGDASKLEPAGTRTLKGVARPVPVHRTRIGGIAGLVGALALSVLAPLAGDPFGVGGATGRLHAQDWPALRDRAYWTNASGSIQAGLSGRLEVDAYVAGDDGPGLLSGRDLIAPRLRIFGDLFVGEMLQIVVEGRLDRGDVPGSRDADARIERAFLRIGGGGTPLALTLGKFPSPVGGYAERHLTMADPFIRPPVPYDQRTVASDRLFPNTLEGFLTWHENPERFRTRGLPPIWQVPYPWGARLDLGTGDTGVHVALVNSAPSSVPDAWAWSTKSLRHPNVVVGARTRFGPEWRLSAWWSRGPWLFVFQRPVPGYEKLFGYDQELVGGQLEWRRGGTLARGEVWLDRWEVPLTDDARFRDMPWSVMLQQDLRPGFYLAGRLGGIRYLEVDVPGRGGDRWDDDVLRAEIAAGWRLARNAGVKAGLAEAWTFGDVEPEPSDGLFAVQLWWEF